MYERVAQIGVDTAQGGHDGTVPRALLARLPAVSSPHVYFALTARSVLQFVITRCYPDKKPDPGI